MLRIPFRCVVDCLVVMLRLLATHTQVDDSQKRILFLLSPHLICFYTHHCQSSSDFKHLHAHIAMLSNETYLIEHITLLGSNKKNLRKRLTLSDVDESHRIHSLCKHYVFHKCLPAQDCEIELDPSEHTLRRIRTEAFHRHPYPIHCLSQNQSHSRSPIFFAVSNASNAIKSLHYQGGLVNSYTLFSRKNALYSNSRFS